MCEAGFADGGGETMATLWEQPAPRGTETKLLHPNKRQEWVNGAMKCDL